MALQRSWSVRRVDSVGAFPVLRGCAISVGQSHDEDHSRQYFGCNFWCVSVWEHPGTGPLHRLWRGSEHPTLTPSGNLGSIMYSLFSILMMSQYSAYHTHGRKAGGAYPQGSILRMRQRQRAACMALIPLGSLPGGSVPRLEIPDSLCRHGGVDEVAIQQNLERLVEAVIDSVEGHGASSFLVLLLSHCNQFLRLISETISVNCHAMVWTMDGVKCICS